MRSPFLVVLLPVVLLSGACSSLSGPTPPPEGAYGWVRQDGETGDTGIADLTVVALSTVNTVGVAVTADMPTAVTDGNGNFTLPLPPGSYELCFVDGGNAVDCDCTFDFQTEGQTFYRYYLRERATGSAGSWQGQWYGHDAQSSCGVLGK